MAITFIKKGSLAEDELLVAESERRYKRYANMRRRKNLTFLLIFSSAILSLVLSAFLIFTPDEIIAEFGNYMLQRLLSKEFLTLILSVTLSAYAANLFFTYLRPVDVSHDSSESNAYGSGGGLLRGYEKRIVGIERKYNSIIEKLQAGGGGGEIFSEEERKEVLNSLKEKLESEACFEYLNKLSLDISEGQKLKQREDIFAKTVARLELEIRNQSKRGNVNLALGIFTTVFGVVILGYSVLEAPVFSTTVEVLSHFLPRLSLVFVIEVFAYFFLRLYKKSLDEIKFFQNEMTNVESKYLGLCVASESECVDGVLNAINQLSITERNFVLEKGQSTVALEQRKIDMTGNGAAMERLAVLISEYMKNK